MAIVDKNYHNLLDKILQEGYNYEDPNRKGVNRLEIPSYTFRHEFKDGFPAITTKKLHYKNVVIELLWFLKGSTNIKYLVDNGCNIWNKDAYNYYCKKSKEQGFMHNSFEAFIDMIKGIENPKLSKRIPSNYRLGDLGPVYGAQWRKFKGKAILVKSDWEQYEYIDQIQRLITNLKEKPLATDHIVNAWNVGDLKDMALPPCHYGFQIVVRPLNKIKCDCSESQAIYCGSKCQIPQYGFELHWIQRSCDFFLGIPYNIASYATLALILEKITGYKALAIQGDLKKVHLYDNSLDAVKEQLNRDVNKYDKCELSFKDEFHYITDKELVGNVSLNKIMSEIKPDWFKLENYESYPGIRVEMLERDE